MIHTQQQATRTSRIRAREVLYKNTCVFIYLYHPHTKNKQQGQEDCAREASYEL